jgi:hypothetical protein
MGADFVPWLSLHLSYFAIYYRPAPQGTGSDWKNLPSTAQFLSTQKNTMFVFIYKMVVSTLTPAKGTGQIFSVFNGLILVQNGVLQ